MLQNTTFLMLFFTKSNTSMKRTMALHGSEQQLYNDVTTKADRSVSKGLQEHIEYEVEC